MKSLSKIKTSGALLLLTVLIAGCATTSTIASRRQAHLATYNALTPEMRAAVDQGQLKFGMNMETVEIAWGKPTQMTSGGTSTGETSTWIYQSTYIQETSFWGYSRIHYAYTPISYVRAQVVFENGVVKNWQTFPAPVAY